MHAAIRGLHKGKAVPNQCLPADVWLLDPDSMAAFFTRILNECTADQNASRRRPQTACCLCCPNQVRVVVGRAICVRLAFRIHVAKCWLMCLRLGFCKMLEPILTLGLSKHTGRGKL